MNLLNMVYDLYPILAQVFGPVRFSPPLLRLCED